MGKAIILASVLLAGAPAWAEGVASLPDRGLLEQHAARRFPQPVRVGDLIGRKVLEPSERQGVLGRVLALTRGPDGHVLVLMRYGGVLGIGGRPVAVPVEAMALLGYDLVAVDYSRAQLDALPTIAGDTPGLGREETIRVGIAKPYH